MFELNFIELDFPSFRMKTGEKVPRKLAQNATIIYSITNYNYVTLSPSLGVICFLVMVWSYVIPVYIFWWYISVIVGALYLVAAREIKLTRVNMGGCLSQDGDTEDQPSGNRTSRRGRHANSNQPGTSILSSTQAASQILIICNNATVVCNNADCHLVFSKQVIFT